jgi:hypothetical protein
MASDHRGNPIHAGKRTSDEQRDHIRLGSELYDREGFERDDNAPYNHGDDPEGANDISDGGEPFETPRGEK